MGTVNSVSRESLSIFPVQSAHAVRGVTACMQSMYTDTEMSRTVLAGYAPMASITVEELLAGYQSRQVVYLDLRKMRVQGTSNLINIGPNSCLAGAVSLVPKVPGSDVQVRFIPASSQIANH